MLAFHVDFGVKKSYLHSVSGVPFGICMMFHAEGWNIAFNINIQFFNQFTFDIHSSEKFCYIAVSLLDQWEEY